MDNTRKTLDDMVDAVGRYEQMYHVPHESQLTYWCGDLACFTMNNGITEEMIQQRFEEVKQYVADPRIEPTKHPMLKEYHWDYYLDRAILMNKEKLSVAQYNFETCELTVYREGGIRISDPIEAQKIAEDWVYRRSMLDFVGQYELNFPNQQPRITVWDQSQWSFHLMPGTAPEMLRIRYQEINRIKKNMADHYKRLVVRQDSPAIQQRLHKLTVNMMKAGFSYRDFDNLDAEALKQNVRKPISEGRNIR